MRSRTEVARFVLSPRTFMRDDPRTAELVTLGDIDALVDHVGSLCFDERWDAVAELHDRCRQALDRGKQLWPAAAYAYYRLALDAPPAWACSVLGSTAERFALGPFSEVIGARFSWEELRGHLSGVDAPNIAALAQERVLRGDDLRADDLACRTADVYDLPLLRARWEPEPGDDAIAYQVDRARFDSPGPAPGSCFTDLAVRFVDRVDRDDVSDGLAGIVEAWRRSGDVDVRVVAVEGNGAAAISLLSGEAGVAGRVSMAPLATHTALAWLMWAAASSGSVGRRRGQAAARADVWWLMRVLCGVEDLSLTQDVLDDLDDLAADLRWWTFDAEVPAHGWALALAIEDLDSGWSWAIHCVDRHADHGPA